MLRAQAQLWLHLVLDLCGTCARHLANSTATYHRIWRQDLPLLLWELWRDIQKKNSEKLWLPRYGGLKALKKAPSVNSCTDIRHMFTTAFSHPYLKLLSSQVPTTCIPSMNIMPINKQKQNFRLDRYIYIYIASCKSAIRPWHWGVDVFSLIFVDTARECLVVLWPKPFHSLCLSYPTYQLPCTTETGVLCHFHDRF